MTEQRTPARYILELGFSNIEAAHQAASGLSELAQAVIREYATRFQAAKSQ